MSGAHRRPLHRRTSEKHRNRTRQGRERRALTVLKGTRPRGAHNAGRDVALAVGAVRAAQDDAAFYFDGLQQSVHRVCATPQRAHARVSLPCPHRRDGRLRASVVQSFHVGGTLTDHCRAVNVKERSSTGCCFGYLRLDIAHHKPGGGPIDRTRGAIPTAPLNVCSPVVARRGARHHRTRHHILSVFRRKGPWIFKTFPP